jgi:hypothetical protein
MRSMTRLRRSNWDNATLWVITVGVGSYHTHNSEAKMAVNSKYPSSRTLREIAPEKIINLQRPRPTFRLFPTVERPQWRLEWTQRDNYRGFQQLRGINGQPSYVRMVGFKRFSQEPGVFGEYMMVDEAEMTMRAASSDPDGIGRPVAITDLVTERQDYLGARETDLLEWMGWALLLNGTFTLLGPTGAKFAATYPIQTATLSNWSDPVAGTPLADLLGLTLLARGKSVSFGAGAELFENLQSVANVLLNNNPADIGGMRAALGGIARTGTPITLEEANRIFTSQGTATITAYDESYNRESDGALVLWIPDDTGVLVGRRTNGDPVGQYHMVRNINNPGNTPGRYTKVIDTLERQVPRTISVHQGHNGGHVIWYPSAIIKVTH